MKHNHLQNFRSLDQASFTALTRHLGFASAVCYRLSGESLVQVLRTDQGVEWPAAVNFSFDYTPGAESLAPLGWVGPAELPGLRPMWRKLWPKGAQLYFPEQELVEEKVVFAVVNAPGKRNRGGEMHAALEAAANRIRGWFKDQEGRLAMSEAGIQEHINTLGIDLHMLLDHELRTPMASVAGYVSLLKEMDPVSQAELWAEYWQVMETETANALAALDKLSLALHSAPRATSADGESFDGAEEVRTLCEMAMTRAGEIAGEEAGKKLSMHFHRATDSGCAVAANLELFRWAVWEVLKNAAVHAKSGRVEVQVYTSDRSLVIDVSDDGLGVSPGSEELIFLRFYQDPGTQHLRKGKRGLGLGLFLARHIAQRHLGQLTFIRQRGSSLFRFVWPLPDGAEVEMRLPKGA